MLAEASHGHKVNFCKSTNETRRAMADAGANSGQRHLAAVSGSAAGGGCERATAAGWIMLIDDRRSGVALPEMPLLAVLPATGGLTRLTDKRTVRRDLADVLCSTEEGGRGRRAVQWHLVDERVPPSAWEAKLRERALAMAAQSDRPHAKGIVLPPLERTLTDERIGHDHLQVALDRAHRRATITLRGPDEPATERAGVHGAGASFWPLARARELDDAILHLRLNEPDLGVLVLRSEGGPEAVLAADAMLEAERNDWLVREIRPLLKAVFKRVELTSRSMITLIEPGSCFAGSPAERVFAADRAMVLCGTRDGDNRAATLHLSPLNFGAYPTSNGMTRLATRFPGEPAGVDAARESVDETLDAAAAEEPGLVTTAFDVVDRDDEVRILREERASFSPDALTAMETSLRFAGLKGRCHEDRLTDEHRLLHNTCPVLRLKGGAVVEEHVPALSPLDMHLRDDFVADTEAGIARRNRVPERAGVAYRIRLPHVAFNRRIGEFAAVHTDTEGRPLDDATWQARKAGMRPTADDYGFVQSLMRREREPGGYAGWIAPPRAGIDNQPGDFEYVKIAA